MNYTQTKNRVYVDSKGTEYKEGDIVYNPCIGDYWVVRESIPTDNTVCPYQLLLWDSREEYFMDLDEPAGFEIVKRKKDDDYKQHLNYIHKVRRHHRWEDFKQNNILKRKFKSVFSVIGFIIGLVLLIFLMIFIPAITLTLITIVVIIALIIFICMGGDD